MTGLQGKRWFFFLWDEENVDHLWNHRVSTFEAEEVFFNPYVITPNKKRHGPKRFRIDGATNQGRQLRLIFEDMGQRLARVITGWELS